MIEHKAPIYIEAHDLARWLLERLEAWPEGHGDTLRRPLATAVCQLVTEIAVALTFPDRRAEHLRHADESVVRTRMLLRLAADLALLPPKGLRHAQGRLSEIGRMLGGWQRQLQQQLCRAEAASTNSGAQGTGSPATTA